MNEAPRPRASRRRADVLLIVGFFAILGYPSLALLERPEAAQARARIENRTSEPRPPIHKLAEAPSEFAAKFKSFFEDQFAGRDELVALNSRLRLELLEVAAHPKIIVGKHGSLFYAGEPVVPAYDVGHEVAKQRRLLTMSPTRLEQLHAYLLSRKKWAEGMGAKFLFVIAPDKTTIYPEFTPDWMAPLDAQSVTDQFVSYMASKGDVDVLDLRPALFRAKEGRGPKPLYYRDDTHWNSLGAFVGYTEISRWLSERFPAVRPLQADDLTYTPARRVGDMMFLLHLHHRVRERVVKVAMKAPRAKAVPFPLDPNPVRTWQGPPRSFAIADPALPRAIVYHDSYMTALFPFLAENFRESVFIRDHHVVKSTLRDYKPDVIIYEMVERNLYYMNLNPDELTPTFDPALLAEDREAMDRGRRR